MACELRRDSGLKDCAFSWVGKLGLFCCIRILLAVNFLAL